MKTKLPEQSESKLQQSCVKWFDFQYNNKYTWFITSKDFKTKRTSMLIKINNEGQRTITNASRIKAEGLCNGAPDLLLSIPNLPFCGLFLELKKINGRLSYEQLYMHEKLKQIGYSVEIIYSVEDFIKVVTNYLNLK